MKIDAPFIQFSQWVPWNSGRKGLQSQDGSPSLGVYVWGHFLKPPSPASRPWPDIPKELIYAGETNNLNRRPLSGGSHHRLAHYRARFAGDPGLEKLYVSVFHIEAYKPGGGRSRLLRAFTRYVEDLVYWEYARRFGERAALDYKKGKGGP
jgi:hypothetical protein